MVEPYFAGPSPLPAYYSAMRADTCSGRAFGRSFLTDDSGYRLLPVNVSPAVDAPAPTLTARCGNGAGASVTRIEAASTRARPVALYNGTDVAGGFGIADRLTSGEAGYYSLPGVSGHVEIHAMGYSLYSPVRFSLRLLGPDGDEVSARVFDPSFEGDSGYTNYDSYLVADHLPPGDYMVEVTSTSLDASMYPAGPVSLDSVPFLVVTGQTGEGAPPLAGSLPNNGRCEAAESFAAYSSPPEILRVTAPRRMTEPAGSGFAEAFRQTIRTTPTTGAARVPGVVLVRERLRVGVCHGF